MLDRTTANREQIDGDPEERQRARDPELAQRQSLPERMENPVEPMQTAERPLASSKLAYARGAIP